MIILAMIPIILMLLPANFFDQGQSVCISVLLFDKECYACGMTRAIQHLIHFEYIPAYQFNKLSFLVLPLLIFSYLKTLKKIFNRYRQS
jgi:hypothetical protein